MIKNLKICKFPSLICPITITFSTRTSAQQVVQVIQVLPMSKRKIDTLSGLLSSSSTSSSLPQPAGPLAGPSLSTSDFTDAATYLAHVVTQRKASSTITTATAAQIKTYHASLTPPPPPPSHSSSSSPTKAYDNRKKNRRPPPPSHILHSSVYRAAAVEASLSFSPSTTPAPSVATLEWEKSTIVTFHETSSYFSKCFENGVGAKVGAVSGERVALPRMKDRASWSAHFASNPPSIRVILQFDQMMCRKVLSHLISLVDVEEEEEEEEEEEDDYEKIVNGWTHQRGLWLYAMLARVERPLDDSNSSSVRMLWRCCVRELAMEEKTDEGVKTPIRVVELLCREIFKQAG